MMSHSGAERQNTSTDVSIMELHYIYMKRTLEIKN